MIELSSPWKRKSILAEPELLKIQTGTASDVKTPKAMYFLPLSAYIAVYAFAMHYVFQTISDSAPDKSNYIFSFLVVTLVFVSIAGLVIILLSKKPLIFTSVGIVGCALMAIKYDQIDGYNWEKCDDSKTTLILLPKGVFSEGACRTRTGESTFGAYGYFFNSEQIRAAEEILEKAGVVKVNIRSWR